VVELQSVLFQSGEPLPVDRDWWWPDDVRKLAVAMSREDREK
jgi:hypothetical protein